MERGLKKQRDIKKSWVSEESLALEDGPQWVLEGLQRGNARYWRDCGGCGS